MEKQINMKCFAVSNENKVSQYYLKIMLSHSNLYPLDKLLNHFTNDEKYFMLLYFFFYYDRQPKSSSVTDVSLCIVLILILFNGFLEVSAFTWQAEGHRFDSS